MTADKPLTLNAALLAALEKNIERLQLGDSFRVFHGRGGCFPGLQAYTLDFFSPVLVLTVFRGEVDEKQIDEFCKGYHDYANAGFALCIQRRDLKVYTLDCVVGEIPDAWFARRGDLQFHLSAHKQNLGYFLDSEPARTWLERQCGNKAVNGKHESIKNEWKGNERTGKSLNVLNLFAFSCSFSVVAIASGAERVINVDMSSAVLNTGRQNHQINKLPSKKVTFLAHDVLRSWGKLKRMGPYDIVLVDPPSFQKGSFIARRDYPKIIRKLPDLLVDGGKALLCLNDPQVSIQEFQWWIEECACPLALEETLSASDDFPDAEDGHLKMLVYSCGLSLSFPPL